MASFHDLHHIAFLSFSIVLLQVVLGPPTFLLPMGFHENAVNQLLSSFILGTCPIHFHLLVFTSSLIINLVLLSISSFDVIYGHLIVNILRRHLNINTWFPIVPFVYLPSLASIQQH